MSLYSKLIYIGIGLALGAGAVVLTGVLKRMPNYRIEEGYFDEVHEFHPFSCERTKANDDAYSDGAQRFVLTTGPSIEALALHQSLHYQYDTTAAKEWHQSLVVIDYKKQHEVCVKNMWIDNINHIEPLTCFDLYELGER